MEVEAECVGGRRRSGQRSRVQADEGTPLHRQKEPRSHDGAGRTQRLDPRIKIETKAIDPAQRNSRSGQAKRKASEDRKASGVAGEEVEVKLEVDRARGPDRNVEMVWQEDDKKAGEGDRNTRGGKEGRRWRGCEG